MALTVVVLGGAGVAPLGSKAIVKRRYCANLIDEGLVVILGVFWVNEVQYAYSTCPIFLGYFDVVGHASPLRYVVDASATPAAEGIPNSLELRTSPFTSTPNCETVAWLPESAALTGLTSITLSDRTLRP